MTRIGKFNMSICSLECIDTNILDESNDIYPCIKYKCNRYHKSPDIYKALMDAILYLKPNYV